MMSIAIILILITAGVSIVAFIAGFGVATIMMPLLVMFMPPSQAVLFVSILDVMVSLWRVVLNIGHVRWNLVLSFGIPCLLLSALGAVLFSSMTIPIFNRALGVVTIGYVLLAHYQSRLRLRATQSTLITGGACYGFFAGAFGSGGSIRALVLTAFSLPRLTYIATNGFVGFFAGMMRIPIYVLHGASLPLALWGTLGVCCVLSFIGAKVGECIVRHVSAQQFQLGIELLLIGVGIKLILFA